MWRGVWWLSCCTAPSAAVRTVREVQPCCARQPLWVAGRSSERGSGTVLAVGTVAVLLLLLGVVHLVSVSAASAAQAARAADLSALAGADVARGLAPGDPCTVAEEVAARNGATLEACAVDGASGTEVTVETSVDALSRTGLRPSWWDLPRLPAYGISRAGPPEAMARI